LILLNNNTFCFLDDELGAVISTSCFNRFWYHTLYVNFVLLAKAEENSVD